MATFSTADSAGLSSPAPDWIALVREKVESLRYGVVQLIVHDGRVTQIERTEKTRLPSTPARDAQASASD
jgi:hypothetical protein